MTGILAFLGAVPSLVKLLREIFEFIKMMTGNDPAGFVRKTHQVISELNAAKTQEERSNAAKKIQDLISGL
jgi:hypothetical protein